MIRPTGSFPIRPDPRDKTFTALYGAPVLPEFSKTLHRPRRTVKDQSNSLSCTAQATTLAAEYQDQEELSAAYTWSRICKSVNDTNPQGAEPRVAMSVGHDVGYLPQKKAKYSFPQDNYQTIGVWDNWEPRAILEMHAEQYKKAAYIRIPKVGDWFDTIKAALVNGLPENQIVMAFGQWFVEWNEAFIPKAYYNFLGWHAYTFIDFDTINGVQYLIAQNSWGADYGASGRHYFPREVINKEFSKMYTGLYVFKDLTPDQIQNAKNESPLGKIQRAILDIWWSLSSIFGAV